VYLLARPARARVAGIGIIDGTMTRIRTLAAVAMLMLVAADAKEDAVKAELERMEGTWQSVSITVDGTELLADDVESGRMTFTADGKWSFKAKDPSENDEGTFTVDPTKSPKAADFVSMGEKHKGMRTLDIYELDGDTMKVCYVFVDPAKGEAKERPTKFSSEKGSGHILLVAKRVKVN
jgi:uncharacterized protein (TIGR03067 family)